MATLNFLKYINKNRLNAILYDEMHFFITRMLIHLVLKPFK
jgi:hypothetical protein